MRSFFFGIEFEREGVLWVFYRIPRAYATFCFGGEATRSGQLPGYQCPPVDGALDLSPV